MYEWLSSSGKRPLVASTDLPSIPSRLLTIRDPVPRLINLIDTGAEISVMPPRPEGRSHSPDYVQLQAANGYLIQTFGRRSVKVELGLTNFTIADVAKPILGVDFLRYYGLLYDLGRKILVDAETFNCIHQLLTYHCLEAVFDCQQRHILRHS